MHKKKATGGIKRPWRGKRAYEAGGEPVETTLGKVKQRRVGIRGGAQKIKLASADWAVVTDKSTGKSSKSKLLRVVKNPANVDYQRRGVITQGAAVRTRPGQTTGTPQAATASGRQTGTGAQTRKRPEVATM